MLASGETPLARRHQLQVAQVALPQSAELRKVPTVSTLARPSFFRSPCIGGQNLSLEPVPPCLQRFMPILKGTGSTLLCSRFACSKRISTPAKSVNSEPRHAFLIGNLVLASAFPCQISALDRKS